MALDSRFSANARTATSPRPPETMSTAEHNAPPAEQHDQERPDPPADSAQGRRPFDEQLLPEHGALLADRRDPPVPLAPAHTRSPSRGRSDAGRSRQAATAVDVSPIASQRPMEISAGVSRSPQARAARQTYGLSSPSQSTTDESPPRPDGQRTEQEQDVDHVDGSRAHHGRAGRRSRPAPQDRLRRRRPPRTAASEHGQVDRSDPQQRRQTRPRPAAPPAGPSPPASACPSGARG